MREFYIDKGPDCPLPHGRDTASSFTLYVIVSAIALILLQLSGPGRETRASKFTVSAIKPRSLSVPSSVRRLAEDDPYAEFRGARYSNDGLLNERDEKQLGAHLHAEMGKKFKITEEGVERANRIGQRVAGASLRPNLVYRFFVIQDREINAFSMPGGYVYITTALMKLANDDELAAVLSHEVGHVVARHSLKTLQQSQFLGGIADLIGSITGIAGETAEEMGATAARIVASGLLAIHSREEEREADFLGVRALPKAGFKPAGMITMFQKIQRINQTDSDLLGSLFSDHPDAQERIDNTRYEIKRMGSSFGAKVGR